jgi:Ca2+-binding RTX toxin-like protein
MTILTGTSAYDTLIGTDGDDSISGGAGNDSLYGGLGRDTLDGGDGNDTLDGGDGNDTIYGGAGNDTLIGGEGSDATNVDKLYGGDGNDTISDYLDGTTDGTIEGGAGDDKIIISRRMAVTTGPATGAPRIDGGAGEDTLSLSQAVMGLDLVNVTNIEHITLDFTVDPILTLYNNNVAAGQTLTLTVGQSSLSGNPAGLEVDASRVNNGGSLAITATQISDPAMREALNDIIVCGTGNDIVKTYFGDDTITGGLGNDTIDGGCGSDTAIYSGAYAAYTVTQNADGSYTVAGPDGTDRLTGINFLKFADQTVTLAVTNATLTGTSAADTLSGGEGNDSITGGLGNDILTGLTGNDTIDGGDGNDSIDGSDGNDTLTGGAGNDTIVGGDGTDLISGGAGNDTLTDFLDTTNLGTVQGGDGDDTITIAEHVGVMYSPDHGAPHVDAGTGNDTLVVGELVTSLDLANVTGVENIYVSWLLSVSLNLNNANVDPGKVLKVTVNPTTTLGGGHGLCLDGSGLTNGATLNVTTTTMYMSGFDGLNDSISGSSGNDVIVTNYGDDTIRGGAGNDTIDGGFGTDTAIYSGNYASYTITTNADSSVTVSGPDGTDTLTGINLLKFADQTITLSFPGKTITGTANADTLTGTEGGDTIRGGAGNDQLYGYTGDDVLYGEAGDDYLSGDVGNDTLYGGDGNDTLLGGDGIDLLDGGAGNDTIYSYLVGNTTSVVRGGDGDDTLSVYRNMTPNSNGTDYGANTIDGGAGNDSLTLGTDVRSFDFANVRNVENVLVGGWMSAVLDIGGATVAAGQVMSISVNSTANLSHGLVVNAGGMVSGGALNITTSTFSDASWGAALNDVIVCGGGNDTIKTNYGNDSIVGGKGNDTIDGGAGIDMAVFSGDRAGYTLVHNTNGSWTVSGPDGTDVLTNIELASFADQMAVLDSSSADTTAPTLGMMQPLWPFNGSGNQSVDYLAITFNETVRAGTGNIVIHTSDGTAIATIAANDATQVTYSGIVATIRPSFGALGGGSYYVTIDPGAIIDWAGNAYAGITTKTGFAFTCANSSIAGTAGNDTLTGTVGDDTITGYGGTNVISGGAGTDTVVLAHGPAGYYIVPNTDGSYTVIGAGETDTLNSIERVSYPGYSQGLTLPQFQAQAMTKTSMLEYIASYQDLMGAFGDNAVAAAQHYFNNGVPEGRSISFSALNYIASYTDLIGAFGDNALAGVEHYIRNGYGEGRRATFDPLAYLCSYSDLMGAFGDNQTLAVEHYLRNGYAEGRRASFNALNYIASYGELISAFGDNVAAAEEHYIKNGYNEGRHVTFDPLAYLCSYADLMGAFGDNQTSAVEHYIKNGYAEGRRASFNALAYVASNSDLIAAFGTNVTAAEEHYIRNGYAEGRKVTFDPVAYLINNTDLGRAGFTADTASVHYINNGFNEGRVANGAFGAEQTNHVLTIGGAASDTIDTAGDKDWFAFNVTAGETYTFTLSGVDSGNGSLEYPFLSLCDGHGLTIASNNDVTGHDARITFTAAASGTFYLVATANDSGTGTYKLVGATGG